MMLIVHKSFPDKNLTAEESVARKAALASHTAMMSPEEWSARIDWELETGLRDEVLEASDEAYAENSNKENPLLLVLRIFIGPIIFLLIAALFS